MGEIMISYDLNKIAKASIAYNEGRMEDVPEFLSLIFDSVSIQARRQEIKEQKELLTGAL